MRKHNSFKWFNILKTYSFVGSQSFWAVFWSASALSLDSGGSIRTARNLRIWCTRFTRDFLIRPKRRTKKETKRRSSRRALCPPSRWVSASFRSLNWYLPMGRTIRKTSARLQQMDRIDWDGSLWDAFVDLICHAIRLSNAVVSGLGSTLLIAGRQKCMYKCKIMNMLQIMKLSGATQMLWWQGPTWLYRPRHGLPAVLCKVSNEALPSLFLLKSELSRSTYEYSCEESQVCSKSSSFSFKLYVASKIGRTNVSIPLCFYASYYVTYTQHASSIEPVM